MCGFRCSDGDRVADAQQTSVESAGEHLLRYFRSIFAWHEATFYIIAALRRIYNNRVEGATGAELNLYLVRLQDQSEIAQRDVADSGKRILKDVHGDEHWHSWVDENFSDILPPHFPVHTEAGCMALYEYSKEPSCSLSPGMRDALKVCFVPNPRSASNSDL